ncbi:MULTISPECIES: tetratricopeptide repeat protein [Arthrobacter]|uniref:Tetratricopeptide repeat protein n=2 Tax=Arthrobacter TaxID=1663 RepID=A0ABU9KI55_9MICC|nr:tetratricopeptide repeat protein [Arthrobacter sp. YJM1]MDP5226053.1 tetratricopeptide repeat protein [Arthrobacter sp. YJM1]
MSDADTGVDSSEWPESGFPGIKVNPVTRRSEVVDEDAVDAALAQDPRPWAEVFVLMARGRSTEAAELLTEARMVDPESYELLLLDTEILFTRGRLEAAFERLRKLLTRYRGSSHEAEILQHLGNTYYGSGEFSRSIDAFRQALELRVAAHASPALIYSSTVALQQARLAAEQSGTRA